MDIETKITYISYRNFAIRSGSTYTVLNENIDRRNVCRNLLRILWLRTNNQWAPHCCYGHSDRCSPGLFPKFLTHGQAVLGVSSGEFAAAIAPGKFTPQQFNAGPSLIEALLNNQIDIGYVGPGPAINGFVQSHGQRFLVVIAAAANNGVSIVARKDAGINSLTDLAGKKIATPQHGNTQDIAARHYLSTTLKQTDLSNVRPIANADQAAAFARGDIDAAWVPETMGLAPHLNHGREIGRRGKNLKPNKEFSSNGHRHNSKFSGGPSRRRRKNPGRSQKLVKAFVRAIGPIC